MVLIRACGLTLSGLLLVLAGCQSVPSPSPVEDTRYPQSVPETPSWPESSPEATPETVPVTPSVPPPARPTEPDPVAVRPQRLVLELEQRGDTLARAGQWQQVIEVAEQGLRMDRRFSGFYRLLGQAYAQLGNTAQAQRFARQATRLCRNDCRREQALWQQLNP